MDAPQKSRKTRIPKPDLGDIVSYRKALGENQLTFWRRFGVTQSGGSRYETGRSIPKPVRLLIALYASARVGHEDLEAAAGVKPRRGKAA